MENKRRRAAPTVIYHTGTPLQRRRSSPPHGNAVDPQQQNRADHGENDAPDRESIETGTSHHVPEKTTEECANDSDQNRDDDATGIVARHDRLRNRASDEPENNPRENRHTCSSKMSANIGQSGNACTNLWFGWAVCGFVLIDL